VEATCKIPCHSEFSFWLRVGIFWNTSNERTDCLSSSMQYNDKLRNCQLQKVSSCNMYPYSNGFKNVMCNISREEQCIIVCHHYPHIFRLNFREESLHFRNVWSILSNIVRKFIIWKRLFAQDIKRWNVG
jgi:hypothetical protein